jgi:ADP-ribose pyrophosphatase YjhB (NUDIX family)
VAEETGLVVEVDRMVGIYTDPRRVIKFSDGEVRQEFSMCFAAHVVDGEMKASEESFEVAWIEREALASVIHWACPAPGLGVCECFLACGGMA